MANLPIPDEPTSVIYEGYTGSGPLSFDFSIFAKADLHVTVDGVDLNQGDFTFTGTHIDSGYDGGSITLATPVVAKDVTIYRLVIPARTTDFAPAPNVPIRAVDAEFDRLTAIAQDARRDITAALDDSAEALAEALAAEAAAAAATAAVAAKANVSLNNVLVIEGRTNLGVKTRYFSLDGFLDLGEATANTDLIQSFLDQGYVVILPFDGQIYPIDDTLVIGNGTTGAASTRSGGLVGAGGATPYGAISTYLKWAGADSPDTPMIRVNGMVYGLQLSGVGLNCDYKCSGIEILGMRTSHVEDNSVTAFMKFALKIIGRSGSAGQQVIQNSIKRNICETGGNQGSHPVDGCKALWLDGDYSAINDPWLNVFEGNRFVIGAATNSCARYLGFCDSNVFIRDHYVTTNPAGAGSTGSLFDATGHNGYPVGNYDQATSNYPGCTVVEGGGDLIGVNYFAGYGTIDLETPPAHAKLRGYTIEGLSFNGGLQPLESDIVGSAWTAFTPTLTATTGAITAATAGGRYKKIGRTVHLNISVGLTTLGTAATALLIGNIPAAIAPQGQSAAVAFNNTTLAALYAILTTGPTQITVRTQAGAFPLANGQTLTLNITYEAAA